MNNNGLSMALNAIEGFVKPESRSFVTGTMLAGYIGQERDWNKKLDLVCDMRDMSLPFYFPMI